MAVRFESDDVKCSYPRAQARSLAGVVSSMVGFPLLMVSLSSALGRGAPGWTVHAMLAMAAACGVSWLTHRQRATRLVIDEDSLLISHGAAGSQRRIPKQQIESAIVIAAGDRERLDVTLGSGEILRLSFATGQAGQALAALDLDGRTRFRLMSPGARVAFGMVAGGVLGGVPGLFLGIVLGALASPGSSLSPLGTALAACTTLLCAFAVGRLLLKLQPELTVGSDGLAWRYLLGRARFARYEQITGVSLSNGSGLTASPRRASHLVLQIDLVGGKSERIAYFQPAAFGEARAMVDRIQEAIASCGAGDGSAWVAELEARGRSVGDWLGSLRELAAQTAGYRTRVIGREQLLGLIDDPSAPAEHRVGAAVVLSCREGEQARERIRVAAESSASPKLRIALDTLASEQSEASGVEEALEEVLEEQRARA